jgi:hypothetical protein
MVREWQAFWPLGRFSLELSECFLCLFSGKECPWMARRVPWMGAVEVDGLPWLVC